jgi:hypothetical protein
MHAGMEALYDRDFNLASENFYRAGKNAIWGNLGTPHLYSAQVNLGEALRLAGRFGEAERNLLEAKALAESSDEISAPALRTMHVALALLYLETEQFGRGAPFVLMELDAPSNVEEGENLDWNEMRELYIEGLRKSDSAEDRAMLKLLEEHSES